MWYVSSPASELSHGIERRRCVQLRLQATSAQLRTKTQCRCEDACISARNVADLSRLDRNTVYVSHCCARRAQDPAVRNTSIATCRVQSGRPPSKSTLKPSSSNAPGAANISRSPPAPHGKKTWNVRRHPSARDPVHMLRLQQADRCGDPTGAEQRKRCTNRVGV